MTTIDSMEYINLIENFRYYFECTIDKKVTSRLQNVKLFSASKY